MAEWARKYGMKVLMHVGGTSVPGSSTVTCDDVLIAKPTVACHLNGGPTSVSSSEAKRVIDKSDAAIEIVHCGNPKTAVEIANYMKEKGSAFPPHYRQRRAFGHRASYRSAYGGWSISSRPSAASRRRSQSAARRATRRPFSRLKKAW